MSHDATGKAWLFEYAAAFGFEPASLSRLFKVPEKSIVPVEAVATFLKCDKATILNMLEKRDRFISTKAAAEMVFATVPKLLRGQKPDAIFPGSPRPTFAWSYNRMTKIAKDAMREGIVDYVIPDESESEPKAKRSKKN